MAFSSLFRRHKISRGELTPQPFARDYAEQSNTVCGTLGARPGRPGSVT